MQKKLTLFYMIPLWLVLMGNCIFSWLQTTYFELYMHVELPEYKKDHPLILFVMIVFLILILSAVHKFLQKNIAFVNLKMLRIFSCIFAAVISSFFVFLFRCGVVCDSGLVNDIVIQIMQGNYEAFEIGAYLHHYPFQIGLVAALELVYRVFGIENYIAFQLINVVSIVCIIFMLQKITEELFDEKEVAFWEAVLSWGMLPLYLYATFIYGDIIGFALGISAICCGIRYIKSNQWRYLLEAGILFAFAIIIKSNIYVLLVAFVIAMLLKMIKEKKWNLMVWLILILFAVQGSSYLVSMVYARRAGMEQMLQGTPKTAWIAMSLQEANEEENGCGWYNGYNWKIYEQNGFDYNTTNEICIENIEESVKRFVQNPKEAIYFFYRKFISQWNAPTFQSLITNEWYSRYTENRSALADFFLYGWGRKILYQWMNFYHLLMFICAGAGCFYCIKNWRLERAYLTLNIFGGVLFHMIWEAQSRYVLGYYVLMLPLAAVGCYQLLCVNKRKMNLR